MFIWLRLPAPWRSEDFATNVRAHGVTVMPPTAFASDRQRVEHAVRINIGCAASRDELATALRIIASTGGAFKRGEAAGLAVTQAGVSLQAEGREHRADHLVIACGAWSRKLADQIGDRILLDTERGYHVVFPSAGELLHRPVCYAEHGFYMTPMADGLRAAGTVELGGLAAPPNPARTRVIRSIVAKLLPGAGKATDDWLGFRPSMPDSLPVIGTAPSCPRVTYAFGHGHLGLTLAGITGRLVGELVSDRPTSVGLGDLRPDRFSRWGRIRH